MGFRLVLLIRLEIALGLNFPDFNLQDWREEGWGLDRIQRMAALVPGPLLPAPRLAGLTGRRFRKPSKGSWILQAG